MISSLLPCKYHVNYKHLDNLYMVNNYVHNAFVDSILAIYLYIAIYTNFLYGHHTTNIPNDFHISLLYQSTAKIIKTLINSENLIYHNILYLILIFLRVSTQIFINVY